MNRKGAQWQRVALPAEHGGWSLVLEPIVLGLLAAFSWPGVLLGLGAFLAYLAFQPLRIIWRGVIQGQAGESQRMARRWAVFYGFAGLLSSLLGLLSAGWQPLWVLLSATPLALIYLRHDMAKPSRTWQAETSGVLAFASVAAGIALAGGLDLPTSLTLWALMAARGVPAVAYIRARIQLDKGRQAAPWKVILLHLVALVAVWPLVLEGWLPGLALAALGLMLLRAVLGLSKWRWEGSTRTVGFMEIAFGAMVVLSAGLG